MFVEADARGTLRAVPLVNMNRAHEENAQSDRPSFDSSEERWFSESPRGLRRSSRPAPPMPESMPSRLDDSIADGWFFDV